MHVYHGTAAKFPIKELTSGPDSSAQFGKPWPGLWLTSSPLMAAVYASWSADCVGSNFMRVIALEMADECPRVQSPDKEEDFLVRFPHPQYESGNLKVIRAYRIRRKPAPGHKQFWQLQVNWDIADKLIMTPNADGMESVPRGTRRIISSK